MLALGALLFWFGALYVSATKEVQQAGGEYIEGVAAQPRYINPLLSQTSEADADLVQLIFSGLMGYGTDGKLEKRLAEDIITSEDKKTYTVVLRRGVKWHDGTELTADDVAFTIKSLQDPAYKSPLRTNWLSVEVAIVDRYTVNFTLKKSYFGFLENLTVGILPKHIWENISPDRFLLADYNLVPIGSGPYRFYDSKKDSSGNMLSYELRAYKEYFGGAPYISKIVFHFYPDELSLIDAYNRKEVMGMNSVSPENLSKLDQRKSTRIHEIAIPRIFAVFFNKTKSVALAYDEVREALNYATDREMIVREVLSGKGQPAFTAFLPFMAGYASDLAHPSFDLGKANQLLDEKGWKRGEDGWRAKGDERLEVQLLTPNWPELTRTAEILKTQWEAIGAKVDIAMLGAADLQQNAIRPREYGALLFGEAAMLESDPFSFWHSSQKQDPGLNLSLFDDSDADKVLQELREESDETKRRNAYRNFQEIILKEHPAVFLYSPAYLYVVNAGVKGMDITRVNAPAERLSNAKDWYLKTQRVKK